MAPHEAGDTPRRHTRAQGARSGHPVRRGDARQRCNWRMFDLGSRGRAAASPESIEQRVGQLYESVGIAAVVVVGDDARSMADQVATPRRAHYGSPFFCLAFRCFNLESEWSEAREVATITCSLWIALMFEPFASQQDASAVNMSSTVERRTAIFHAPSRRSNRSM
jgi:hypothetical protein